MPDDARAVLVVRPAHGRVRRWATVAIAVAVLISLPWLIGQRTAPTSELSAEQVLTMIQGSDSVAYSGYAESAGGLVLPATDQLADLANLASDRTRTRVWYRGPQANRVDTITVTGETDVYTEATGTWAWSYEKSEATFTPTSTEPVTIPASADMLPPALGRRLLSGTLASDIARIPTARIAGRTAVGIEARPRSAATSIGRIDVWADSETGLPLRVAVYPKSGGVASMDSAFLNLSLDAPATSIVRFTPPNGARVQTEPGDLVQRLLQRIAPLGIPLPVTLGGLPRTDDGSVIGVATYGQGPTTFVALQLSNRFAGSLREVITASPGAVQDATGLSAESGVLSLLITGDPTEPQVRGSRQWVLAGTVTVATLHSAAQTVTGMR